MQTKQDRESIIQLDIDEKKLNEPSDLEQGVHDLMAMLWNIKVMKKYIKD